MEMIDEQATERILKARSELILARRFYGVLVSNVEPVCSRRFPTMATNSKQHFFNPDFIMSISQDEVLGTQAHESEHDARHHGTRRNGRDPKKWNEACDFAINLDLIAQGFKLPEGALIDERFRDMSAEDIYRTRELDEQRAKQQQPEPEDEQSEDEDEGNGASAQDQPEDDTQADDESEGGSSEDDQDGEDEAEDGEGGQDGDDSAPEGDDTTEGEGGDGNGEAEDGENADGEGETPAEDGNATGGHGQGGEEASKDGHGETEPQSCGDPGGCGEVLDAAEDAAEIAEADQKWERIKRQAASMAKAIGQLPGHVSADIARANDPGQDWREVLRAWFDQGALQIETWNRPNRRLIAGGIYLPGRQREGVNRAVFLIDTSASCDAIALGCVRNEAQIALDDGAIDEIVVIYGDVQVTRVDTYRTGDEIDFDPRGRGGTDMKPLFKYVEENVDDPSLIVCFSDMEIGDPGPQPSCPVLFAAHGYPDRVRNYIANAPWGAPGIDVGAH